MKTIRRIHIVEIIVVCAILAILLVTTYPHFMINQIRANLAQAVSDLSTISNAINAYYVDYQDVPPDFDGVQTDLPPTNGFTRDTDFYSYRLLTTPTSYLSQIPEDIFIKKFIHDGGSWHKTHHFFEYSDYIKENLPTNKIPGGFTVISIGPDLEENGMWQFEPTQAPIYMYHMSNGLESNGDIYASHEGVILPY